MFERYNKWKYYKIYLWKKILEVNLKLIKKILGKILNIDKMKTQNEAERKRK